jgi:hypothetical protein
MESAGTLLHKEVMMNRHRRRTVVLLCLLFVIAFFITAEEVPAQEQTIVFRETFDNLTPPGLPAGWRSSRARNAGINDFSTTSSSPASAPNAVLATDATTAQWLAGPVITCGPEGAERLQLMVRRSGTFSAAVTVEVSLDSGRSYPHSAGTLPKTPGAGAYQACEIMLPPVCASAAAVSFRWRILPDSTGTSGTIRFDDVVLRAYTEAPIAGDSLVINEIMYTPGAQEPEWIEVYNRGRGPVDLRDWLIADALTSSGKRISVSPVLVQSGACAVLTGDSAGLLRVRPDIPSRVVPVAGFPSLNNSGDMIRLLDASGSQVDSVAYFPVWGGGVSVSLERIDPSGPSGATANWATCVDSSGATPGRPNSVRIRNSDLRAGRVMIVNDLLNEQVTIRALVHNAGRQPGGSCIVRVFDNLRRDSLGNTEEMLTSIEQPESIAPGDSAWTEGILSNPLPGKHLLVAFVEYGPDERPANNVSATEVYIPLPAGALCVNEILFAPLPDMAEYVELLNVSGTTLDLWDCCITDRATSSGSINRWVLSSMPNRLDPGGFFVLASDSTVFSWFPLMQKNRERCQWYGVSSGLGLHNDGDAVVVLGPDGTRIDSVEYSSSWHSKDMPETAGRSLEKIHPSLDARDSRNWGSSVNPYGGTPGFGNSIAAQNLPPAAQLSCAPNPFSPDGDGRDDVLVIRHQMPIRSGLVRIRLFDVRGRKIRELLNSVPAGAYGDVVWDGRDDEGRPARIGIYVVFLEGIDGEGGVVVSARTTVVLAKRL